MKIAYLSNIRFPSERAHAIQITQMCDAFFRLGIDTTLFVNKRVADKVAEDGTFKVKRLSHGFFLPSIKIAFYSSELFFACSFLFRENKKDFDIVYSRHEWIIWFLAHFISPSKLVWESHEAKLNFPARRLLKRGIKTVVISEGIFEDYAKSGVPKEQMIVAHDGIDESFFKGVEAKPEARNRLGLSLQENIVMYIGGFDTWKGVETFFAAADLYKGAQFVAVGGSSEQLVVLSKKYPKVSFLGQLPYSDLKDNQQAADVLVIPNSGKTDLSARYTSPLKLFAHMASSVPIVASDIPSLVTVTGRQLVTLVVPDSPEALAKGIEAVFADYDHKTHLAQELKQVSLSYTWNNRAKNIIDFISLKN